MISEIKVLSVNINRVSSKLEDQRCLKVFCAYDIVCLSEVKCSYPFSMPGYKCIRSNVIAGEEKRGGVAVLLKNHLFDKLYRTQIIKDQVWFSLKDISGVRFGAVYVAPRDSLYYWEYSFASILDKCISTDESVVILGDINARVPQLEVFVDQNLYMHYTQNPDKHQNANG